MPSRLPSACGPRPRFWWPELTDLSAGPYVCACGRLGTFVSGLCDRAGSRCCIRFGHRFPYQLAVALAGCDSVIHLAFQRHGTQETCAPPLVLFREVNVRGDAVLAQATAQAGVRCVTSLSLIKIQGESTALGLLCWCPEAAVSWFQLHLSQAGAPTHREKCIADWNFATKQRALYGR